MNTEKAIASIGIRQAQPFSPEEHELARKTIVAAMSATRTARSRDAAGKIIYVAEPDWPIRLTAAVKVAEFVGGKPIAMSVTANLTPSSAKQEPGVIFDEMLHDPEKIRIMQGILDTFLKVATKAPPIDIETSKD